MRISIFAPFPPGNGLATIKMCSFITAALLTWLNLNARAEDCSGQEEGEDELTAEAN